MLRGFTYKIPADNHQSPAKIFTCEISAYLSKRL